ncbi:hypothetical protein EWM64_g818 [Hericium alpestre]|uniref:Rad4 beta-hairpin domain-containing protein n=1 Tax=Hericium alpestre TaxID=135208 RepID=A0A4Z0AB34_9AGAM|nr:hypothetical protein EWM64_g818 [Hericium alpestre]
MSAPPEGQALLNADSDDDEMDWEEVDVPQAAPLQLDLEEGPSTRPNIEITLKSRKAPHGKDTPKKKPGGMSQAERLMRIDYHKIHTVALLANGWVRNKWINDSLLHARLLSLTPMAVQNSFAMIHKSRIPEAAKRGHLFEMAITRLVEWWMSYFNIEPSGHIRSRTFDEVQNELIAKGMIDVNPTSKGKGKARQLDLYDYEDDEEVIHSEKSLMKHALQRYGSRDVSAQLFTALCRSLDIPARLVVSLQSVPWQASVGKPKPKAKPKDAKGKAKEMTQEDEEDEADDMEEVDIPSPGGFLRDGQESNRSTPTKKGKEKAPPVIKLRKTKSKPNLALNKPLRPADPTITPPVFWTEVFSRPDARWIPVDPIRGIVNKRKVFDPSVISSSSPEVRRMRVDNRMTYVVAFEEDGYARDVTTRYARQYGAKVAKTQADGKGREHWWESVLSIVTRPYRLHRDDVEDDELTSHQMTEAMPTTIAGFKDHPLYILQRHLHKDQQIAPNTPELGKFRGEPVYPRGSVLSLKTAENWMRRGRTVKSGEQPMKWVKQRASTVSRKRELEVLREAGAKAGSTEEITQGLHAAGWRGPCSMQVRLLTAAKITAYLDIFVDKGAAKIARQLGFDYAEAVTGFEFKKRRAFPVITGIVIAAENEDALLEAYWEAEHLAREKEEAKRKQAVTKRWIRLVHGLRLRKRLQEQYADEGQGLSGASHQKDSKKATDAADQLPEDEDAHIQTGGFLTGADDVVQPYSLPKTQHPVLDTPRDSTSPVPPGRMRISAATSMLDESEAVDMPAGLDIVMDEEDEEMEEIIPTPGPSGQTNGVPKSMAELAALATAEDKKISAPPLTESARPSIVPEPQSLSALRANGIAIGPSGSRNSRSGTASPSGSRNSPFGDVTTAKKAPPRLRRVAPTKGSKRARAESVSDASEEEVSTQPPSRKRSKAPAPVSAPASDRVLRSRRGKTAAHLQAEQDQEAAFRQAIAE